MSRGAISLLCALMLPLGPGCGRSTPPSSTASAAAPSGPPTSKEIVGFVFGTLDIPLSVHASCEGVGSGFDDKTIGDFLGGFLAELGSKGARNWLEMECGPESAASWPCRFVIRHSDGEEEWGWGIRFSVDRGRRRVVRESIQCVGSG